MLLYFTNLCKPVLNDSMLQKLWDITVSTEEIISLICKLKEGKTNGPDNISANMLAICDDAIAIPLKLM